MTADLAAAMASARARRDADEAWRRRVRDAVASLAATGRPFTSDDAVKIAGPPPEGTSPNTIGSMFGVFSAERVVRPVGYDERQRRRRHPLMKWVGIAFPGPVGPA